MINTLKLTRFKNFQEAELVCGPLTLLIGTNASGKSNVRDAFRFLHGIGRGCKLAEIVGEKYESGALQWQGIRGGLTEITYDTADTFALELSYDHKYVYRIEVNPLHPTRPRVVSESLYANDEFMFEAQAEQPDPLHIKINIRPGGNYRRAQPIVFISDQPVLSQILQEKTFAKRRDQAAQEVEQAGQTLLEALSAIRFLDLSPDAMRNPAFPGQPLGDRGENLSAVLLEICENATRKRNLAEWLKTLTPMDVQDFDFIKDQQGRVSAVLIEAHRTTSIFSASDGTLRFLAIAAALLAETSGQFYFLEEIENGIHPTRLHLLLDLIEQNVAHSNHRIVATTHSPQLLRLVNPETLAHTSLIYRLEGQQDGHIQLLQNLPQPAREILYEKDRAALYESGWFENIVSFMAAEEKA